MSRLPTRRSPARYAPVVVLAGALLAGLSGAVAAPAVAAPESAPTRTVTYHGYQVEVPATWRVVDLAQDPGACVRFDQPAVYLGHPGDQAACPAHLAGRTAGLLVEPIDAASVQRTTRDTALASPGTAVARAAVSRNDSIQIAVQDAGVLVTAADTPQTEPAVRRILDSAALAPGGTAAALPPDTTAVQPLAASGPQPGTFLGKGFDACTAPSQSAMDAWLANSVYRAVGVYISGSTRACGQPNLTATWVTNQTTKGWHLIPIEVGRQAPCSNFSNKMSTDPATARSQGSTAANGSADAAQALGIPAGSALYNDIEGYNSTASCKASVLSFLSGWTDTLHARGYLSGFYSSGGSGIRDAASAYNDTTYTRVDHIWFAVWNGAADTDANPYAPDSDWPNHQRIHQYQGGHNETHGGVTINIDNNFLDVAAGTPAPPPVCSTVSTDFTAYPAISSGATGAAVKAAQCLLKNAGFPTGSGDPTGTFDAGTVSAVKAFQTSRGMTADGAIGSHTWTALLSVGTKPTLSQGATGSDVSRLQRSLTAALSRTVSIDGDFGPLTTQAVKDYQTSRGLGVDGIVGSQTWTALQAGK